MDYNFTKFESVGGKYEERITLTKSFSIGLPSRFYDDNKIKSYKYAILYWDAENQAIGIQFTNNDLEKGKFKVIHNNNNYGGGISARSFLNHNKIDVKKYHGKYLWEKVSQGGVELFVIKLTEK